MTKQELEALRLAAEGMYHADSEHDACGVGLIGEVSGKPTRRVVDAAIDALSAMDSPDQLQIARLKKRKLQLRDRMAAIEDELIPDIIA